MRIFLTGATGYIGSAIARAAAEAGHVVHALAHHRRAAEELEARGYLASAGDVLHPDSLTEHATAADAVIHAASTNGEDAAPADRAATEAMVEALRGTGRPFVYTSGVWVLGPTGTHPADENAPPRPLAIVAWRAGLEAWLRSVGLRTGVRTIAVRPGIVWGDGGGIPGKTARGELPLVGTGAQRWPLVHRDDLAELYVAAAERAPTGSILHGVSEHAAAADVAGAFSAGRPPTRASLAEARANLGAFAEALALDQRVSSRITRRVTGWSPRRLLFSSRRARRAAEVVPTTT